MRIWRSVSPNEEIRFPWGVCWWDYRAMDVKVTVIPLNVVVRLLRALFAFLLRPWWLLDGLFERQYHHTITRRLKRENADLKQQNAILKHNNKCLGELVDGTRKRKHHDPTLN